MSSVVYPRDMSWYSHTHGGSGSRYHWPHDEDSAMAACSPSRIVLHEDGVLAAEVPDILKCGAPKRYRLAAAESVS